MRHVIRFFLCIFACMACAEGVQAHPRGPSAPYVVTLEDPSGRELRTFHHRGETFILGNYGERYNIRVRNRTGRRVEAVVTVDGRDVISGAVGDFVNARGYLIDPYGEVVIEGFRQNLSQVAAFRFSSPGDSYSARMGTPENVGIVGVAIFPERVYRRPIARKPKPRPHMAPQRDDAGRYGSAPGASRGSSPRAAESRRSKKSSRPSSGAAAPRAEAFEGQADMDSQNLGTEYGETRHSSVREVHFVRDDRTRPARLITLRYDDREGLRARGIRVSPQYRYSRRPPEPFPHSRFAPPPPRH